MWVQGEPTAGLWLNVMLGDSNSILGVKSSQLDRSFTPSASMWWMPDDARSSVRGEPMRCADVTPDGFSRV